MAKPRKFAAVQIRKITGGKDPVRLIEEFIMRQGFDPDKCQREKTQDNAQWMVPIGDEEELEVLVYGLTRFNETTIYMGLNVVSVPIRAAHEVVTTALEVADSLVGIKVSLVGHFLVLSSSFGAPGISLDDIEYAFKLIKDQKTWFREALADELGWEELPE